MAEESKTVEQPSTDETTEAVETPVTVKIYKYDENLTKIDEIDKVFKSQADADAYELADGESYLPSIAVYVADDSNVYLHSKLVRNDYKVTEHESLVSPSEDGIGKFEPITLTKATDEKGTDTWMGTDQDVWQKAHDAEMEAYWAEHPDKKPKPDPTTEALAQITLSVAQNKADQDAVNAQLILASAQTTVGGES